MTHLFDIRVSNKKVFEMPDSILVRNNILYNAILLNDVPISTDYEKIKALTETSVFFYY